MKGRKASSIMASDITADFETLLKQAPMTAHDYFHSAVRTIDESFGEGYAAKHPELVGAYMKTCAADLHTSTMAQQVSNALHAIANAIRERNTSDE
jgi:hypothetical protein